MIFNYSSFTLPSQVSRELEDLIRENGTVLRLTPKAVF